MTGEKIGLTRKKETLLIPLYAKAKQHRLIHDPTAADILTRIDYDFTQLRTPWVTAVTLAMRANTLDGCVRESPAPLVLHLGCGLDARVHRVDSGARWYDIDYPEVIELRRLFYAESDRRRMIASSVTDLSWIDRVEGGGPATIIAEGLFMYLTDEQVRELVLALRERFPGSRLAFDAFTTFVVRRMGKHPSIRKTGARIQWGLDDPAEVCGWAPGVELLREQTFAECPDIAKLPAARRLQLRLMFAIPMVCRAHRILQYQL